MAILSHLELCYEQLDSLLYKAKLGLLHRVTYHHGEVETERLKVSYIELLDSFPAGSFLSRAICWSLF